MPAAIGSGALDGERVEGLEARPAPSFGDARSCDALGRGGAGGARGSLGVREASALNLGWVHGGRDLSGARDHSALDQGSREATNRGLDGNGDGLDDGLGSCARGDDLVSGLNDVQDGHGVRLCVRLGDAREARCGRHDESLGRGDLNGDSGIGSGHEARPAPRLGGSSSRLQQQAQ